MALLTDQEKKSLEQMDHQLCVHHDYKVEEIGGFFKKFMENVYYLLIPFSINICFYLFERHTERTLAPIH